MSKLFRDNNLFTPVAGLRLLLEGLDAGKTVVAATLTGRDGNLPPGGGAKLLVGGDGTIVGGAEGGVLERRIAARAVRVLASGQPELVDLALLGDLSVDEQAALAAIGPVFLERVDPDQESRQVFAALRDRLAAGRAGLLLSPLEAGPHDGRRLLWPEGMRGAALPEVVRLEALRLGEERASPVVFASAAGRFFLESFVPRDSVYIAGAGRVSRLLATLASFAGFRVVVLDVDAAFANRERFPSADEVAALPSFAGCFADRPMGASASVVVVTRGHVHDREVLAQALASGAGYVGLMACRADGRATGDALYTQGFSREVLDRVHTPIGLPLGGGSPEEIAMSIAAELIAARSDRRKGRARD
jgi:xanthine dehydrogenase accessory factor